MWIDVMRKFKVVLWIIVGICVLISCKNGNENCHKITIDYLKHATDVVDFDTNRMKVSYVSLELNDSCLIRYVWKLIPTRDYFFIHTDSRILQFSRDGRFVRQIGRKGRGPGEYSNIVDFTVDDKTEDVYIADVGKISVYDHNGCFLKKYACPFAGRLSVWDGKYLLINPLNVFGNAREKLVVMTLTSDTLLSSPNNVFFTGAPFMMPSANEITKVGNQIVFRQQFNDTIYTYDPHNQTLSVRYYFDFGSLHLKSDLAQIRENKMSDIAFVTDVIEDENNIFLQIQYCGKDEKYIIDKSNWKVSKAERGIHLPKEGVHFWPFARMENMLISVIMPISYLEKADELPVFSKFGKVLTNLGEDANPILMLIEYN